jgi:hypothetical protein
MKSKSYFREENLYPIWENFCKSKSWSDDLRLQGLNAGKLNIFEGPDFQGADFELDGKIYHGDVEIHQTASEWYQHHHHLDRRYNSVQLHLVWYDQPEVIVCSSEERNILTFDMKKLSRSFQRQHPESDCRLSYSETKICSETLRRLSLERLNYKIIRIKNLVKCNSYDQVIFLLFMNILGSPNNSINFEFFASSLPWEEIYKIKNKNNFTLDKWIRFFLDMSGLHTVKQFFRETSGQFRNDAIIARASPLSNSNWQYSGQRPKNHPIKHVKLLAIWLKFFKNESLYFALKSIITQRLSPDRLVQEIEDFFSPGDVTPRDCICPEKEKHPEDRWGRAKMIEVIGNALIPFFYWESLMTSSFGFLEYLKDIYFTLPQLNRYAKLKKIESVLFLGTTTKGKFYKNQGLLYVYKNYCTKRECHICPLLYQHKEIDKNFENI